MAARPAFRFATAVNLSLAIGLIWVLGQSFGPPALNRFLTEMFIYVVAVVGLQIFIGNSGIVSFGHSAFMLIAAYASAWQTCCPGLKPVYLPGLPDFLLQNTVPLLPATLIAASLAALVAALIGLILMRLSGIGASIALFAFLAMMRAIYESWTSWTAGASTLIGLPLDVSAGTAAAWAVVTVAAAVLFRESRYGLMLRASQDDLIAARASGVPVLLLRILALSLSAFFVGVGGVLLGHFLGALSVRTFWLDLTFLMLAMLIFGGRASVTGAVLGAVLIRSVISGFRLLESGVTLGESRFSLPSGSQELLLAIIILVVLTRRPGGLTRSRELTWPLRAPR
ncbi:branched-chain amino acid ABC transporter permease [Gemmobacter sp. 24YEA27]|uniref:branched-chain amino acid ABC transporter permease n=1 Tax=Gemmobacter sp. 24YEA27 TaxID=3040672 RepID=UPI0024B397AD|nr:branched-chain amino acid ABC transporter permease [Gemmobacter sp. 24YEA27]